MLVHRPAIRLSRLERLTASASRSADGGHWNAYGNRLVASTLADFITENGLLAVFR